MIEGRTKFTFDNVVRGILWAIVITGIVMLLNRLSAVLVPFFLAWLIAYLLFPLVKFFQYRCHLKYRFVGILCSFLVVGLVLTGIIMLMVPPVVDETMRVKELLVAYLSQSQLLNNVPDTIEDFIRGHLTVEDIKTIVTHDGFLDGVKATVPKLWDVITQSISVVSSLFTLTMVVLYTLLILLDYERLTTGWPRLLPERYRPFATQLVRDVEESMNKYFRGQAMVAFCVGILFSIGFLIIAVLWLAKQWGDKHPIGCVIGVIVIGAWFVKTCREIDEEEEKAEKARLEEIRRQSEMDRRMREWEREWRERMKRDEEAAREPAKTGNGSEEVKFWEWGAEQ